MHKHSFKLPVYVVCSIDRLLLLLLLMLTRALLGEGLVLLQRRIVTVAKNH